MDKIKIGILPTSHLFEDDDPYNDTYSFINNYCKRIFEAGGIPIGLLLDSGTLHEESLEMCDAFLICGGRKMEPYAFKLVNYAKKHNKPLLGICMGMQIIGVYSYLEKKLKDQNINVDEESLTNLFKQIRQDKINYLTKIEKHYIADITRDEIEQSKHFVNIDKASKLYDIYKQDRIDVLSLHSYMINLYNDDELQISCHDDQGVIEGLEYKNDNLFILGVQFHPEVEDKNINLFKRLIDEAWHRKENS